MKILAIFLLIMVLPNVSSAESPVLLLAETQDLDGNGYIDNIKLTFSENIKDVNLLGVPEEYKGKYFGYAPGIDTVWTAPGFNVLGINLTASEDEANAATGYMRGLRVMSMQDKQIVNVGDIKDDNIIWLTVKNKLTLSSHEGDTGITSYVSMKGGDRVLGGSGLSDISSNYAANISDFQILDSAPPQIMAANMNERTKLKLYVSEPWQVDLSPFQEMLEWWENTGNEKTDWGSQVIKFEKDSTFSLYNIDIQKPGIPGYIDMTISYHAAGVIEDLHRMKNVLFPDQGDTVDVVINIGLNIENSQSPSTFSLFNNFPNPFNPFTTINYTIAENGSLVSLIIYDLTGREIRTLVDEIKAPGFYSATWDGRDDTGAAVSSGIYLYRLICGDFEKTGKMALVR